MDVSALTLATNYKGRPVIGMTDNSYTTGVPVNTPGTYGVFAFLPAYYGDSSAFNIILYALFNPDLTLSRFFFKGTWGNEGVWKEIALT